MGASCSKKQTTDAVQTHNQPQPRQSEHNNNHQSEIESEFEKLQQTESNSLLKKHLTREIFDQLKDRKTEYGGTLHHVIVSGVVNPDASVGVYAPDADAYKVFAELLDPIIEDYHHFPPNQTQPALDLGEEERLAEMPPLDPQGKYIQSTRIRCGRSVQVFSSTVTRTPHKFDEWQNRMEENLQLQLPYLLE